MDFTFLDKCLCAIGPERWRAMNEALGRTAVERGQPDPSVVWAGKGFSPRAEKRAELEAMVETLAIPRRMADLADAALRGSQWFRAGIEGTISALKRAFRLFRCLFRGFKTSPRARA